MGKCWILIFFQPIWSIWYSETFSTCFQTKCHFRNIEFVNNLVRYDFGSVISVSVIFFRFSVFRYFGKNTVSVEHYHLSKIEFGRQCGITLGLEKWSQNSQPFSKFNSCQFVSAHHSNKSRMQQLCTTVLLSGTLSVKLSQPIKINLWGGGHSKL